MKILTQTKNADGKFKMTKKYDFFLPTKKQNYEYCHLLYQLKNLN